VVQTNELLDVVLLAVIIVVGGDAVVGGVLVDVELGGRLVYMLL
jgi:hypothetical protein